MLRDTQEPAMKETRALHVPSETKLAEGTGGVPTR